MIALRNRVVPANDPLLHEIDLPFHATYHPLGFRMHLASNSRDAIDAAHEAWGSCASEFDCRPLDIRVVVQPEGALADEAPIFRGQGSLISAVYDRHNFGAYEANSLTGYCFVSEKTAADHIRLRLHFLEAMVYSLLAQSHAIPVHAAAVARHGSGFLLCGSSGAGKSTLAYACARTGWTVVSDDASWIPCVTRERVVLGRPAHFRLREDAPRLFPELGRYTAQQRPGGKVRIEAPLTDFPYIRTAPRCPADHLVLLDRRPGRAGLHSIPAAEVVERLLADQPAYAESVWERSACTLDRLLGACAWRLEYETLPHAVALLSEVP